MEIASGAIVEWQELRCYNGIMKKDSRSLTHLTDGELLSQVKMLAGCEVEATAQLIASLGELDVRKLYLGQGFSSLFTYCTQHLRLSEHAAYGRIEAARAARKWPGVLEMLADRSITLTTICLLANHLTDDNHLAVLGAAKHRTRREVEQQVAALRPLPPVPSTIRRLPLPNGSHQRPLGAAAPTPALPVVPETNSASTLDATSLPTTSTCRPVVAPLSPERFKVQVTISRETHDKLRRVQDLLRHVMPDGDPAEIFDRALTVLLADLQKRKLALTDHPRSDRRSAPGSRHVPATVRREVWRRDGGRCAFVGAAGRCTERGFLEFHHVIPFADGGETTTENLQLRCRAHNAYEAAGLFGPLFVGEEPIGYALGSNGAD